MAGISGQAIDVACDCLEAIAAHSQVIESHLIRRGRDRSYERIIRVERDTGQPALWIAGIGPHGDFARRIERFPIAWLRE